MLTIYDMRITIKYGHETSQFGELYLPKTRCIGVVCLLHGGFWTMPYSLEQFYEIADELSDLGYCVWNIEYRRIGEKNRKWTDTFDDVINGINEITNIKNTHKQIDSNAIFVVGHSAGGHLAIWLNSQRLKINVQKFIGLSPILDLEIAYYGNSGNGAVEKLLDGKPDKFPERYLYGSPINLPTKNSPELIIHGKLDKDVPIKWSEMYYDKMKLTGKVSLIELDYCGHMDFINPQSKAFDIVKSSLSDT